MKLELEAVAASKSGSSRSRSSTVAFSWEHEPGVSKQSHSKANKPAARGAPRADSEAAVSRRTPMSTKKQAPAAVTAHPHRHRLRVLPPPGGPGAPVASPPGRRKPRSSRRVRPAEDPFLASYLTCTKGGANDGGSRGYKGALKLLGLGFEPRGLGLSCKSSCGAVEECVGRHSSGLIRSLELE